jgi:hypothetical protein
MAVLRKYETITPEEVCEILTNLGYDKMLLWWNYIMFIVTVSIWKPHSLADIKKYYVPQG